MNSGAETIYKDNVSAPEFIILCGFLLKSGAKTLFYVHFPHLSLRNKEFGYKFTKEDMSESDPNEKYSKGNYYFLCDKNKKTIELHYDFMKAQNFG